MTSQASAGAIESAFNTVAGLFGSAIGNAATVNINVGWGEINGSALPSSTVGASQSYLQGYYTYDQIKGFLTAAAASSPSNLTLASALANLPAAAPSGAANYVVTSALGKALGIVSATATATDGFIGFAGSPAGFGFTPASVTGRQYDFQAVAAHEISEVLGRISGLDGGAWRTPLDLFRYSAAGSLSFTFKTPSYFSIDGGATALQTFNSGTRGDRGDWLTPAGCDRCLRCLYRQGPAQERVGRRSRRARRDGLGRHECRQLAKRIVARRSRWPAAFPSRRAGRCC